MPAEEPWDAYQNEMPSLPDGHWAKDIIEKPLHERFDRIVVPMTPQEWAERYEEAVEELRELKRRSPFPQLYFAAIRKSDVLTYLDLENRLDF